MNYITSEQFFKALRDRIDITVRTLDDRDALLTYQRRWGMVCYVYDDGENNGAYVLTKKNDVLGDNTNWRPFPEDLSVPLPNAILWGGIITWTGVGLIISVSATYWRFDNEIFYTLVSTEIELDPADSAYDRYDTPYVDNQNQIGVITGEPAENPIIPAVDPSSQIALPPIRVSANVEEPPVISNILFDEGESDEWTPSASVSAANWDATINPMVGSIHGRIEDIVHSDYVDFTPEAPFNIEEQETFSFGISLLEKMTNAQNLYIIFNPDSSGKQPTIVQVKLLKTLVDEYQKMAYSLSSIPGLSDEIDTIRLFWNSQGSETHAGFDIDYVKFEKGVTPPTPEQEHDSLAGIKGSGTYHFSKEQHEVLQKIDEDSEQKPLWNGEEWPGGEGGGHTLQTPDGTDLPAKPKLRAKGGLRLYNEAGEEVDFTSLVLDALIELGVADQGGTVRTIQAVGSETNIDVAIEPKGGGVVKSSKWAGTGKRILGVDADGKSETKETINLVSSDSDLGLYLGNKTNWDEDTNTCAIPDTVSFDRGVRGLQFIARNPSEAATFKYFCDGPEDTDVIWLRTPWTKSITELYVSRNSINGDDYDEIVNTANYNGTTGKYEGPEITTIEVGRIIINANYLYVIQGTPSDTVFRTKRHI